MSLFAATLLLFFLLLACSAFFSASETALFSLPQIKIHAFSESLESRRKKVADLVLRPKNLIVTIFFMNTLMNILLQNTASSFLGKMGSFELKVGVPLIITLLFGEIFPKNIALHFNERISLAVAPVIDSLQRILKPLNRFILIIAIPLSRFIFFFLKKNSPLHKEEVDYLLTMSKKQNLIGQEELRFIRGYLALQEAKVKEVMRPKGDILSFSLEQTIQELTELFVDKACSRLPVIDRKSDKVLGILHARDFFLAQHEITTSKDIRRWLCKPLFVPENMYAKTLLRRLATHKEKMALVVNEYGSLTGLITQEDLLEIVIGDVSDIRHQKWFIQASENEIIANGKLEIADLNHIFKTHIKSEHGQVTLGGFLTEKLGCIPTPGTTFQQDTLFFHVLSSDNRRIEKIFVRKEKQ